MREQIPTSLSKLKTTKYVPRATAMMAPMRAFRLNMVSLMDKSDCGC
jgi:hypothetical protein